RLAGVARDGHLLGLAARGAGELDADGFYLTLERGDHGVVRTHIGVLEVAPHSVLNGAGGGAAVPVVQGDDVASHATRRADVGPEICGVADFFARAAGGGRSRGLEVLG